jgi:type II secretory pathway pseudopilin PulG
VIAIIAILAAMLMPALESARERAQSISCLSKVREMGRAQMFYANDNDGYLTPVADGGKLPEPHPTAGMPVDDPKWFWFSSWMSWVHFYLYDKSTIYVQNHPRIGPRYRPRGDIEGLNYFYCPSAAPIHLNQHGIERGRALYAINDAVLHGEPRSRRHAFDRIHKVGFPSDTHLISDNGAHPRLGVSNNDATADTITALDYDNHAHGLPGPWRHMGDKGGNVVHVDGHAAFYQKEKVYWMQNVTQQQVIEQKKLFRADNDPRWFLR